MVFGTLEKTFFFFVKNPFDCNFSVFSAKLVIDDYFFYSVNIFFCENLGVRERGIALIVPPPNPCNRYFIGHILHLTGTYVLRHDEFRIIYLYAIYSYSERVLRFVKYTYIFKIYST